MNSIEKSLVDRLTHYLRVVLEFEPVKGRSGDWPMDIYDINSMVEPSRPFFPNVMSTARKDDYETLRSLRKDIFRLSDNDLISLIPKLNEVFDIFSTKIENSTLSFNVKLWALFEISSTRNFLGLDRKEREITRRR